MGQLVRCPMCDKEISPNAISCPHCGEPLKGHDEHQVDHILIAKPLLEVEGEFYLKEVNAYKPCTVSIYKEYTAFSDPKSKEIYVVLHYHSLKDFDITHPFPKKPGGFFRDSKRNVFINKSTGDEMPEFRVLNRDTEDVFQRKTFELFGDLRLNPAKYLSIFCPNCKSDNVERISGASKAGSSLLFGLLALSSLKSSYKCKSCGYKW